MRFCAAQHCGALVERGYCDQHRRAKEQARGSRHERGYDAQWSRVRAIVIAREPLCRACAAQHRATVALDVDHIVPIDEGGARYDLDNLQPLCRACHNAKTRAQNAKGDRGSESLKFAWRGPRGGRTQNSEIPTGSHAPTP